MFLKKLEKHFAAYPTPDNNKIIIAEKLLKGEPRLWYNNYAEEEVVAAEEGSKWTIFKQKLSAAFAVSESKLTDLEAKFYAEKQEICQKLTAFVNEKIELARKIGSINQNQVIRVIKTRATPGVQDYLSVKDITTVDQCYIVAREYDQRHHKNPPHHFHPVQKYRDVNRPEQNQHWRQGNSYRPTWHPQPDETARKQQFSRQQPARHSSGRKFRLNQVSLSQLKLPYLLVELSGGGQSQHY